MSTAPFQQRHQRRVGERRLEVRHAKPLLMPVPQALPQTRSLPLLQPAVALPPPSRLKAPTTILLLPHQPISSAVRTLSTRPLSRRHPLVSEQPTLPVVVQLVYGLWLRLLPSRMRLRLPMQPVRNPIAFMSVILAGLYLTLFLAATSSFLNAAHLQLS